MALRLGQFVQLRRGLGRDLGLKIGTVSDLAPDLSGLRGRCAGGRREGVE